MSWADVVAEAWRAVVGRPGRSTTTALGISLGVLALTVTVGVSASAAAQVTSRFDALQATTVTVSGFGTVGAPGGASENDRPDLPSAGDLDRVRELNGVVAAGIVTPAAQAPLTVSRVQDDPAGTGVPLNVLAIDVGAQEALRLTASEGRSLDAGHQARTDPVVLVGELAAASLGLVRANGQQTISVDGHRLLVAGIVGSATPGSPAALAVLIPESTARRLELQLGSPQVVITTRQGAAQQVGGEAPIALRPNAPESLSTQVPPDPRQLRAAVGTDTRNLFLALATLSLLISALGVSNTTLVAVTERRFEIGVRRAIGATRRAVLLQFLVESAALGLAGGVLGALVGIAVCVGVALAQGWVAVIPVWLLASGPVLGLGVGVLAGLYPAWRATRIDPASALAST